jgi:hypothetical protein
MCSIAFIQTKKCNSTQLKQTKNEKIPVRIIMQLEKISQPQTFNTTGCKAGWENLVDERIWQK